MCRICPACVGNAPKATREPSKIQLVDGPKARYVADLKELNNSLKQSGYFYLLNIVDAFSRFSWSYLIRNKEAATIHKYF